MPQLWRLVDDSQTLNSVAVCGEFAKDLDDIVRVRLRVDTSRHRQTDQIHARGHLTTIRLQSEHDCADFARSNAALLVERHGERLAWVLQR